jgi:DNA segregation ATPase FtsK/SpoIIIE, S-DNA-T family
MDGNGFSGSERLSGDRPGAIGGGERLSASGSASPPATGRDSDPLARRSADLARQLGSLIDQATLRASRAERDIANAESRRQDGISAAASRVAEGEDYVEKLERGVKAARLRLPFIPVPEPADVNPDRLEELKRLYASANSTLLDVQNRFFKGSQTRVIAQKLNSMRALVERIEEEGERAEGEATEKIVEARLAFDQSLQERDSRVAEARDQVRAFDASLPPAVAEWSSPRWDDWTCATAPSRALRLGSIVPTAPWLPGDLQLPLVVDFPAGRSLMLLHDGRREQAADALRSVLLRIMASLPPGSFEFSFVDPVGLGETVAPFLHLAEFDDSLVGGRVATQAADIEARIGEAIVHVETVVQQYLRSNYATIDEYNEDAGEIAERYRFLVLCDFPAGMDDRTIAKVESLIEHGPRAGLYVVLSAAATDASRLSPNLRGGAATVLELHGQVSDLPVPAGMTIASDSPPPLTIAKEGEPQGLFAQVLTNVGVTVRGTVSDAVGLERVYELNRKGAGTPFASDVPSTLDPEVPETWWKDASLPGLRVPVGRAGARKLCYLPFDSRTLASAMVVGAPGTGKTTFLHAVILGLAMAYSPTELEMYLLDSKQGVEFKVYEGLPHAKAIAIRNEREFGVSVLAGLRQELDRRAALIKNATGGSQVDLAGFREETGEPMPRIVLVADEFHELFERVDKLGQEAADLLDDLVRQGRSYGIHVLLGSQTLDGVEALPRHTLQLIQGRVAFSCREQDAIVVMREDNREVRTLSGPGDGIWNPERGDPEANVRFQGLLIEPRDRVRLARTLRELADDSGFTEHRPVVFDGDEAFPMDEIRIGDFAPDGGGFGVRLGEPCAVGSATWARFPRRPGSNLLALVPDRTSLAVLHSSLAAVMGAPEAEAVVVDLLGDDDAVSEAFTGSEERLRLVRRAGAGAAMRQIADLVAERVSLDDYRAPTRVLVLNGLKGLRDPDAVLDEEDGRSFSDLLESISRDGPEVGVHVVVIGDSLATVERRLGLDLLKEFGLLLAGPMSRDDSERVLDSELAAELKPTQALFKDDSNDELTKVRCYEPAAGEWVRLIENGE